MSLLVDSEPELKKDWHEFLVDQAATFAPEKREAFEKSSQIVEPSSLELLVIARKRLLVDCSF